MVAFSAGLLASVMLLQPAAATFNWGAAKPFNSPNNNNNICTDQQKGGFDWKNLPSGNFNKFGDFDFSGFSCKDSFSGRKGRRALEARNGFQQKVIEGRCTADQSTSPKISCGADKNFSLKEMQITVEFDTDIDFEYTMPDGSSCKQTQKCSAGGSTISNRQCGGAQSVTFKRPKNGKDCNIGIHKVDFDCEGPAPPPPPPPPSTSSTTTQATTTTEATTVSTKSSSTVSTTTTTSQTSSACTSCSKSTSTSTTTSVPSSSSSPTSTVTTTTPLTSKTFTTLPPYTNTTTSQSTESNTSSTEIPKTLTSTTSELPNTLTTTTAPETVTTTSEQVTTELTFVTLTTCDVTLTQTTDNITLTQTTQTLSTTTLTSTVTFCPKCGETVPTKPGLPPTPPSSTGEAPPPPPPVTSSTTSAPSTLETSTLVSSSSAVPPPPPPPPADTPQSPCPETLPRCMNTWLSLAKCSSNSDASCMCPNSEFTKGVISCVTAWGASDKEIQAALSYFAGICAKFVPQNPGICTDVPTSITLIPTITPIGPPSPPPSGTAPPPPGGVIPEGPQGGKPPTEVPRTTITLVNTITVTGSSVQTTTQFITVPQVTFVTGEPAPAPTAPAENGGAAPPPAQPSVGLVPMPQPVQAGPTTPPATAATDGAQASTTTASAVASNPIASVTGGAANPQISQFEGAATGPVGAGKGAVGFAGALALVVALAL